MLIDKKLPEYADFPSSLEGEVFLKRGKRGIHTIKPEYLKWLIENKPPEWFNANGYAEFSDQVAAIKNMTVIAVKPPSNLTER